MTCIIALETGTSVTMAADRCTSWGGTVNVTDIPKVWTAGEALIGSAGKVRMGNLLRVLQPPFHTLGWDTDWWVTADLIPAMIDLAAAHHYDKHDANRSVSESQLLFAVRGRVYAIWSDWSWTRNPTGEYSIGSGSDHAQGALAALRHLQPDPRKRCLTALDISATYTAGGAGPFDILTQEANT